ncbi:MAG: M42 family metallopeptidase [Gemmatimonadetes bacterium]|nr:M42 family metallopeptidase [Gemmatimonadota bacterium]MYC92469.1 M42 family metallopeptidase [Gemmatimonadota bacterium]MYG35202.1 M42 family metallopeptidase [Gemmatimonadota bacterium]
MNHDISFLERLLDAPGPSGFETRPAGVWRDEAASFANVWSDVVGNSYAAVRRDARPLALMAGHIDEIGLQVTHADKSGLLYFAGIGGWDAQVLVGQRVRILGARGDVPGVIGRKAIHLMEPKERDVAVKVKKLWIDVGAGSRDELGELGVRVGDPAVLDGGMVRLAGDRVASRAIDNRVGAFVVLEALRLLAGGDGSAGAVAVATAQEEIGYSGGGARTSAFDLSPDVALVVDVTHATDVPGVEKTEVGEHSLGGGPVLTRGSSTHPAVFELLAETAESNDIPYSIQAAPLRTATDADGIHLARGGVPTGLVSVPNRYMHSPCEMVATSDLFHVAHLLAAFVERLDEGVDFGRR